MEKVIRVSVRSFRFRPLFSLARFALIISGCGDPYPMMPEDPVVVAPDEGDVGGVHSDRGDDPRTEHEVPGAPSDGSNDPDVDGPPEDEPSDPGSTDETPTRRPPRVRAPLMLSHEYPDDDDGFGHSVAVSIDTVVVGVPGDDGSVAGNDRENDIYGDPSHNMHGNYDSGAVYVYDLEGNKTAYLKAIDIAPQDRTTKTLGWADRLGTSVAIDGDVVVAGAPGWEDDAGKAYVFERDWTTRAWRQTGQLVPEVSAPGSLFGQSVAIHGEMIVVGAPREEGEEPRSGAAYVFERVDGYWKQTARLKALNAGSYDEFGTSVAVTEGFIVVGAPFERSSDRNDPQSDNASSAGAAYVFERGYESWLSVAYLKEEWPTNEDQFGMSVAIDRPSGEDVVRVAVGAPGVDEFGANEEGTVTIFELEGDEWIRVERLVPSGLGSHHRFGHSIDLDGDCLVVGAPSENTWEQENFFRSKPPSDVPLGFSQDSGAVYVFKRTSGWNVHGFSKFNRSWDTFYGTSVAVETDSFVFVAGARTSELRIPARPGEVILSPLNPPRFNSDLQLPPTLPPGGGVTNF